MDNMTQEILETVEEYLKQAQKGCTPKSSEKKKRMQMFLDPSFRPAINFEKEYGLQDIAQQYRLPKGLSPKHLEVFSEVLYWKNDVAKMEEFWRMLTVRNPSLKKIEYAPSNRDDLLDLIWGVASGFNTSDIQYFISGGRFQDTLDNPAYKKLEKIFNQHASRLKPTGDFNVHEGVPQPHIFWVPSPQTVEFIQNQVLEKIRPKKPAAHKPS